MGVLGSAFFEGFRLLRSVSDEDPGCRQQGGNPRFGDRPLAVVGRAVRNVDWQVFVDAGNVAGSMHRAIIEINRR